MTNNSVEDKSSYGHSPIMAIKIRKKGYHLTNEKTGEYIIVYPPHSGLPGLNMDAEKPKDSKGRWIRLFTIVDPNGIKQFFKQTTIVLKHLPKERAYYIDKAKVKWSIYPIKGTASANSVRK